MFPVINKRINYLDAFPAGLTFYKGFHRQNTLNADHALGSPVATFTASRSATNPATYIDAAGVVQLVTSSNTPRYAGGYYDTTGFHALAKSGVMIEAAATNLIPASSTPEAASWTKTNVTADNDDAGSTSPDGTATAPSLTATAANGTFLLTTAVTARTFSIWLKRKTGTGNIQITADSGATWTTVTLTTSWIRVQVTAASASQTCGIRIVTSSDAVYAWGGQFETSPYATSYIPTTSAALTRNAETLTFLNAGNRTAAQESIFIKFTAIYTWGNNGLGNRLIATDTKDRLLSKVPDNVFARFKPNNTDNGTAQVWGIAAHSVIANVSQVVCGVAVSPTGDPNQQIYYNNSISIQGSPNIDWTLPAWGTKFWIGSDNAGINQLDGIIQSIAFFNRALSAAEVAAVTNILNA